MKLRRLVFALLCGTATFGSAQTAPDLATLRPAHPRLIAGPTTWADLGARRQADPQFAALLTTIENDARSLLTQPPVEYRKIGRRLLDVSRRAQQRTLTLALAFRLTGDPAFLRRAEAEMLAAAAFSDWNPSHFLDVAEMTTALALGYDWLHADLSPGSRAKIRTAIVEKGLRPALETTAAYNSWQNNDNNWNQVCFGGLILGALAVGDEEPEVAAKILALARPKLSPGLKTYAPDGVFPEGPGYWSYGTSFSVLTVAALESALGSDWQIPASPGFMASAGFFLQATAPSGMMFDFSDSTETGTFEPILFWFARRSGNPGLIRAQLAALPRLLKASSREGSLGESGRFLPLAAIWYPDQPAVPTAESPLPLRWHGDGPNPVAIFRSSWTDPSAFYLALKGGAANLSHAHMDAGSFVFEARGVRWARDLGRQEYESLESKGVDLWNRKQDSPRWSVFRLNNRSHNTLTIDGRLHRVGGAARITDFSAAADNPFAIVDLSSVFAGQAGSVRRGFRVLSDRALLVQDELTGLKPGSDVTWTMVTAAEVTIAADGQSATLRENKQTCTVRLCAPAAGKLSVIAADPPADNFNAPNPGRRLLHVHVTAPADGTMTIAVWLDPGGPAPGPAPRIEPLEKWLPAK